jgi:hypothetical protein
MLDIPTDCLIQQGNRKQSLGQVSLKWDGVPRKDGCHSDLVMPVVTGSVAKHHETAQVVER